MQNLCAKNYAQLDLEAMTVDFALTRFCLYLVGAPNGTIIVTDHSPLLSVFNGKRNGSIRVERIKLRHQDIRFLFQYKGNYKSSRSFKSTWYPL